MDVDDHGPQPLARRTTDRVTLEGTLFDKFLQWSGIVSIVAGAISYGIMSNRLDTARDEIILLRQANEARVIQDVETARDMATKTDVLRLSEKIDLLIMRGSVAPR